MLLQQILGVKQRWWMSRKKKRPRLKCIDCDVKIAFPHPQRKRCGPCQIIAYRNSNKKANDLRRARIKNLGQNYGYMKNLTPCIPIFKCQKCGRNHFVDLLKMQKEQNETSELIRFTNKENIIEQLKAAGENF